MARVTNQSTAAGVSIPRASIIIASYNAWMTIQFCLEPIVKQAEEYQSEIILVDSSTDETDRYVAENFPQVRVMHFSERKLPEEAKQIGVNHASSQLLVFIDADCMPDENWLAAKLIAFQKGNTALMGPIYCHPECPLIGWAYYFVEFSYFLQFSKPQNIRTASNCNFAVEKSTLVNVSVPPIQSYAADAILFRNIINSGHTIYFDNLSAVFHFYDGTIFKFLMHEFTHGKDGALLSNIDTRKAVWILAYLVAGPILPFLKLAAILSYLQRNRHYRVYKKFLASLPLTFCGTAAWTWGSWWGYLLNLLSYLLRKRHPVVGS